MLPIYNITCRARNFKTFDELRNFAVQENIEKPDTHFMKYRYYYNEPQENPWQTSTAGNKDMSENYENRNFEEYNHENDYENQE